MLLKVKEMEIFCGGLTDGLQVWLFRNWDSAFSKAISAGTFLLGCALEKFEVFVD